MRTTYRILWAGVLLLALVCASGKARAREAGGVAPEWRERAELGELFAAAGVTGTFVVYDPEQGVLYGCNRERAETRLRPASTFKILNSLIAFETGVVKDADDVLVWNGQPQSVKAWERDMTIREAIAASNVPAYQDIARRIGLERMRGFVRSVGYGNADIGDTVDDFWLAGPLAISAVEQVRFLDELLRRELPFTTRSYDLLESIMPAETTPEQGRLFFKTGLAVRVDPNVGWLVGWVNLRGRSYPFALNLDVTPGMDIGLRLSLARQALQRAGL